MIVKNDYFELYLRDNDVMMRTLKKGYPLKSFDIITRDCPRLKINSFVQLRNALIEVGEDQVIGTWLPRVEVSVAQDKMKVEMVCNVTAEEAVEDRDAIIEQANKRLDEIGVIYGRKDLQQEPIIPNVAIIVAEGKSPVKGKDAEEKYIELPDRKPVIREDGKADHYEMNFVFHIEEGDWLGEKTLPGKGENGYDIYGNEIRAVEGSDVVLYYDKKSVFDEQQEDVIVLRALNGGALEFTNGAVSVGQHLAIAGDVGVETGTITFDGSVSVAGTIQAGYSVKATGDISIEGTEGVTNAKLIQSTSGDIYVKGGVFGGGETVIEAKGNVYIKHGSECKIYAKEVHVGLYLFGTTVEADEILVDTMKGRIIGGNLRALYKIEAAMTGNSHERLTTLHVEGINREHLLKEVQEMAQQLKDTNELIERLEEQVRKLTPLVANLKGPQKEAYDKTVDVIEQKKIEYKKLEQCIQVKLKKMKSGKEGTIEVTQEAFAGTSIQIGKSVSLLQKSAKGLFKLENGILNV